MDKSDLASRMKRFYEEVPKTKLMRRCPVAIRIDGKSFHTFTRKCAVSQRVWLQWLLTNSLLK